MKRIPLLLLIVAPLAFPQPVQATVMLEMGLAGLVARSDKIVIGKVEGARSRWTDDHRYIVTDAQLRVSQTLYGKADETITIRRLGGVVDGIGMKVVGSTVLQPGEQVLLFSQKRGHHRFVVGMQQGVYHLLPNAEGRTFVSRRLQSLTLAKRSSSGGALQLQHGDDHELQPEALEDFLSRLRETIKRCTAEPQTCRDN